MGIGIALIVSCPAAKFLLARGVECDRAGSATRDTGFTAAVATRNLRELREVAGASVDELGNQSLISTQITLFD
jgi:hypothetical protein